MGLFSGLQARKEMLLLYPILVSPFSDAFGLLAHNNNNADRPTDRPTDRPRFFSLLLDDLGRAREKEKACTLTIVDGARKEAHTYYACSNR